MCGVVVEGDRSPGLPSRGGQQTALIVFEREVFVPSAYWGRGVVFLPLLNNLKNECEMRSTVLAQPWWGVNNLYQPQLIGPLCRRTCAAVF